MKKLITALSLLATTITFAQSNNPGTIQLGVNWGVLIGGVNTELNPKTAAFKKENNGGAGVGANYAFRAQFGIIKQFSAGAFVRRMTNVFAANNSSGGATYSDYDLTLKSTVFGAELKYYAVNHDKFAFYLAPTVGLSVATTNMKSNIDTYVYYNNSSYSSYSSYSENGTASGLNYGLTAGINWYWADFIGMSADIGLNGSSLSGTFDNANMRSKYDYTTTPFGFVIQVGIITKFGGKKKD